MEITTMTLGLVGLAAAAVIAIVRAWPRRRVTTSPYLRRPAPPVRPDARSSTDWFSSDPVLFVGSDAASAGCGAGSDGGGGSCD